MDRPHVVAIIIASLNCGSLDSRDLSANFDTAIDNSHLRYGGRPFHTGFVYRRPMTRNLTSFVFLLFGCYSGWIWVILMISDYSNGRSVVCMHVS